MTELVCNVVEDLQPLICPIEDVDPLPGNPRRGHVESIKASLAEFGQDKPIVVRRTSGPRAKKRHGQITKGNHTRVAALELGWTGLAMVWIGEDVVRGNARAIADNRTSDLSTNEDVDLLAMLEQISERPELLDAASYTTDDIDDIRYLIATPPLGESNAERTPGFTALGVQNVILPFPKDDYETIVPWLAQLREQFDTDNNSTAIYSLLRERFGDAADV